MLNWEERRLMVKVSKLYYFEGLTQAEIAKKQGVSRPVISKLLNAAKKEGIVEIYIKDETVHTVELEEKLRKKYDLKEVLVVSTSGFTQEMAKRQLGKTASSYISKNLSNVKSLGISWGSTLLSLVDEYPFERRENIHIIPIIGGMGNSHVYLHSNQLAYNLAQKMNATCSYLYAPAMVENDDLKERLVNTKDVSLVLEEGKNVDMALVGIGNPFKESTLEKMEYLNDSDLVSLHKAGAVGNIGSCFFNEVGEEIDHPLNDRFIGLNIEEIKQIPEVIGIVEGSHKLESIEGALLGGCLNVLITDDRTAQALL
ncbi:sugar-binding transcriptional regulator [Oceanobacillus chungangensis]|uniref:Transcriptional regulator n=1 Tax=Oceanobacillus chungangensis TaxID=1229152 RepID=A0A3D8PY25_9BACI|nr:sugar-binding transcriptional regulator [Oceanobacillus chungangensis]RDW20682.1 transcriptional regulator [Oceanobacillus chungangensis]